MKQPQSSMVRICAITTMILICSTVASSQSFDIYSVDTKSGTVQQITKIPDAGEFNASWSPDAKKIAHDVVGGPAWWYGQSIFITDVKTRESIPLIGAEGGNDAAWSPNGETIAFDLYGFYILTVPARGGVPQFLRYDAISPDWSPDSERIVFYQPSDGSIRTMNVTTYDETFIAYGSQPVWSPNGRFIAYEAVGGIWTINIDINGEPLTPPVQITNSGGLPSWSNNSHFIVFHDWPEGDPDIYIVPVEGGTPSRLGGRTGSFDKGDYDPSYSDNGQYVAYSSFTDPMETQPDIYRSDIEDPSTNELSVNLEQNFPNPFHAKTTIGFQVPKTQHVLIKIYNLQGEVINTLIDADYQPGHYTLQWNGEDNRGQSVVTGIYLYQLQTGNSMQIKRMSILR
jgi:Tol biopolymer transport system component